MLARRNYFADDQSMISWFTNLAYLAFEVSKGSSQDRHSRVTLSIGELFQFVSDALRRLDKFPRQPSLALVNQVNRECLSAPDQIIAMRSLAEGDHEQGRIKRTLGQPAYDERVVIALVFAANNDDVQGIRNLPQNFMY